ncbi:MAG TPA: helix-turn-helix transcriptional regulator [Thermoanaerobaculia bacterium]|nr:helix-turn-helix transcriptional regulator [Thermoanaerobaculia bacterium]
MSPKKNADSASEPAEVEHVIASLKAAIRVLGYSIRDIEKKLGYSYGYLSRVFGGTIELKVEHVMDIARALEMAPEEILAFIYPTIKDPPSESAALLWKRLGGFAPTGTYRIRKLREGDEGYEPDDEDGDPVFDPSEEMLERVFRRTLSRVLGQVADALAEEDEGAFEVDEAK